MPAPFFQSVESEGGYPPSLFKIAGWVTPPPHPPFQGVEGEGGFLHPPLFSKVQGGSTPPFFNVLKVKRGYPPALPPFSKVQGGSPPLFQGVEGERGLPPLLFKSAGWANLPFFKVLKVKGVTRPFS